MVLADRCRSPIARINKPSPDGARGRCRVQVFVAIHIADGKVEIERGAQDRGVSGGVQTIWMHLAPLLEDATQSATFFGGGMLLNTEC